MKAIWIGERLRVRRKQLGFTMEALAGKVGTKRSHVSMWEDGLAEPQGRYLVLLARVVRAEPEEFYDIRDI